MTGIKEVIQRQVAKKLIIVESTDDPSIINFRMKRCESCERLKDGRCSLCDCFYDLKATSLTNRNRRGFIEITHCPLGKWGDREIALQISKHKKLIK